MLLERLHTNGTLDEEQVQLNQRERRFPALLQEPSDGREPSTPSLPEERSSEGVRAIPART